MEWLSLAPIPAQFFFGPSEIRNLSGFTDLKVLAWSRIESKGSTKQTKDEMSREARRKKNTGKSFLVYISDRPSPQ